MSRPALQPKEDDGQVPPSPSTQTGGTDDRSEEGCDSCHSQENQASEPTLMMQVMLCLIAFVEGGDTQLVFSVAKNLQDDLGVEFFELNYMTIAQTVCTNIAAPFWGILADRGVLRRKTILVAGAAGQGLVTISLAFVDDLAPMIALRAINGIFLAALRPISNGIIADMTAEQRRGKIFGRVQAAVLVGMSAVSFSVVPIASREILGFQGWRVAFGIIGAIAICLSSVVLCLLREPPHLNAHSTHKGPGVVWDEIVHLFSFLKIPTFCMMILQGIFGTMPWASIPLMVLYFQLSGVPDAEAGILGGAQPIAGIFGNVLGGLISDTLTSRLGLYGRPLNAQITVAVGIPLIYMVVYGIPPCSTCFWAYFFLIIAFGLLGSWAQSGTNFPVLSHIVPATSRSRILAWEMAFENSIAAALAGIAVTGLAKAFGYTFDRKKLEELGTDPRAARALGKAMAVTICIPWVVTFLVYGLMHWTYPRDMRLLESKQPEQDASDRKANPRAREARSRAAVGAASAA